MNNRKKRENIVGEYLKEKEKGTWIDRVMFRATWVLVLLMFLFVE